MNPLHKGIRLEQRDDADRAWRSICTVCSAAGPWCWTRRRAAESPPRCQRTGPAKRTVVAYDRRVFTVREASRLPCDVDVQPGDRVRIVLTATVKDYPEVTLARDGAVELNVLIEAYDGRITKVLDRAKPKPRRRKVSRAAAEG